MRIGTVGGQDVPGSVAERFRIGNILKDSEGFRLADQPAGSILQLAGQLRAFIFIEP